MKVIIPVAGAGTRLRPHTYTQPKPLMPVAGKPILAFIVERLLQAGFKEFVFVIGYLGEKIEMYINENYPSIKAYFVIQSNREGLGHAIWLTRTLLHEEEEIFIALGDTIFETDLDSVMASPYSSLGVKKVDDPRNFGVAEIGAEGFINRLVEKPEIPRSNMALVGLYKIKEAALLMDCLGKIIEESSRTQGEFHLTDALMQMVEKGTQFTTFKVLNWYDCGKKDILLETNAKMLRKMKYVYDDKALDNVIIVPPVSISPTSCISNSIIGPNVSVGDSAAIQYSVIQNSIIGNYARLDNVILNESVVGSDSLIKGNSQSLNIGDNTEIDLAGG